MKMKHRLIKTAIFCWILILPAIVRAGGDESYSQALSGKIKKGDSCTVTDDKFLQLPSDQWSLVRNLSVNNVITFQLRTDTAVVYHKPFSCTLSLTVKYFTSRDQQTPSELNNINLVVHYDTTKGSHYVIDSSYRFKNAFKVIVVVDSIFSPEWGSELPPVFRIRNQIIVKRKYPFSPVLTNARLRMSIPSSSSGSLQMKGLSGGATTQSLGMEIDDVEDQLFLSWEPSDFTTYPQGFGAPEEYDLEWTFIDEKSTNGAELATYAGVGGTFIIPGTRMEELMRSNASRITTSSTIYTINLAYPSGYILVRVRGVDHDEATGIRLTSNWVYILEGDNTSACRHIDGHENNLNWQFTSSFAEEGKHKDVISYFDGSLRTRQSVTINNSDNIAVTAETIYDKFGRPTVNILPAPVINPASEDPELPYQSKLKFYDAVNRNGSGVPYSYNDLSFVNCQTTAALLGDADGAGNYYSPSNPLASASTSSLYYFSKYIPDAEGYPFSVTEYTPDGTGRIRRQGGLGQAFQLGNHHETKYMYGKPTQKSLYRLFGMEVGNASHYLKNMIIDPNGQVSVSYIDAAGKTIATALAYKAPDMLDELPSALKSEAHTQLNDLLIAPSDMQVNAGALKMETTATFLATATGPYRIVYEVDPAALVTQYGQNGSLQLCNNCYYDVLVTVKNECGDVLETESTTPFQLNDMTCHTNPTPFTSTLNFDAAEVGEYTIYYSLRLSEDAIKSQVDYYVQHNTDLKTINNFFKDELIQADLLGCYSECSTCMQKLGSPSEFATKMNALLLELKNTKYANSPELAALNLNSSEVTGWISSTYQALLDNCTAISQNCKPPSPCESKLELLKYDVRPGGQYALYTHDDVNDTYAIDNTDGTNVLVNYINVSNTFVNDNNATVAISSLSASDFIRYYLKHPEWADYFVTSHIEYCSYQWCMNNSLSEDFDERLRNMIDDGDQAVSLGFFDRNNLSALVNADPFFTTGNYGATYKTQMINDLNTLSKALKMTPKNSGGATLAVKNIIQLVDWQLYCAPRNPAATATDIVNSWTSCSPAAGCRSVTREWQSYRDFYLQVKSRYVEKAKQNANPNCVNCFVGTDIPGRTECTPLGSLGQLSIDRSFAGSKTTLTIRNADSGPFSCTNFVNDYLLDYECTISGVVHHKTVILHKDRCKETVVIDGNATNITKLGVRCFGSNNIIPADCQASTTGSCPTTSGALNGSFTGTAYHEYLNVVEINASETPEGSTITMIADAVEVPNYFTIKDANGITVLSSGWVGHADWGGVWGSSVNTPSVMSFSFIKGAADFYYLSVQTQTDASHPSDAWNVSFGCQLASPPAPIPSFCSSDPRYVHYKNKVRIFNDYIDNTYLNCLASNAYISDDEAALGIMRQKALDNIPSDEWREKLKTVRTEENFAVTDQQIDDIIIRLVFLVAKAIEIAPAENIRPASTLPVGVTDILFNDNNFTDIFTSIVGSSLVAQGFGPELLEQPYPWDKSPVLVNPVAAEVTSDLCARISSFSTTLQSILGHAPSDHELQVYLVTELKEDYILTEAELSDIRSKCAGGCTVLNKPLTLPAAFATPYPANPDHASVSCSRISALKSSFTSLYGGIPVDTKLYRVSLTNYLNHQLGYSLSWDDYNDFAVNACVLNSNALLYTKPAVPVVKEDDFACTADVIARVFESAAQEYSLYIEEIRKTVRNNYISRCLANQASARIQGDQYEYHYTLYYYDQAGNLVKTIPPEGVRLLSDDEIARIGQFASSTTPVCTGIPTSEDANTTFTALSNTLQGGTPRSIEMWLNNIANNNQVRIITPDKKYLYQVAIKDGKLWAEMYTLSPGTSNDISITLSAQAVANINGNTVVSWSHVVVQSATSLTSGDLQLYYNGQLLTNLTGSRPGYPFEWTIDASTGSLVLPAQDIAALKHLRAYSAILSATDILNDYNNSCMSPDAGIVNNMLFWGRFNIPQGGGVEYADRFIVPNHYLPTTYEYNSLGQIVKQSSPDGGTSEFFYDRLGRLIISQNEEQKSPAIVDDYNIANRYSYTKYDKLGRATEVGEKFNSTATVTEDMVRSFPVTDHPDPADPYYTSNSNPLLNWMNGGNNRQVTLTVYDNAPSWVPASLAGAQFNLRKRVAVSAILENGGDPSNAAQRSAASYYSYDIIGNVNVLTQENYKLKQAESQYITGATGLKQIKYEYDLQSGKVNKVLYQDGKWDQFYYQYLYDADNRLVKAYSSRQNIGTTDLDLLWIPEATYRYYIHGPLARVQLGKQEVQGLDYAYTLQGWLKGVNSNFLDLAKDMSNDSKPGTGFEHTGRDVFGFSLSYFNDPSSAIGPDYKPIGGTTANAFALQHTAPALTPGSLETGKNLYNGNIRNATYAFSVFNNGAPTGYTYRYDQLNRLTAMNSQEIAASATSWSNAGIDPLKPYAESISYDANGNILTYDRNGPMNQVNMDKLTYQYPKDANGNIVSNKLRYIHDQVNESIYQDIKNQKPGMDVEDVKAEKEIYSINDNYQYDKIGNLVKDGTEHLDPVKWTVYGKIASISKTDPENTTTTIQYSYDAGSNRIFKSSGDVNTYYVRDAQGNVLGVYELSTGSQSYSWIEQHLYGSSRVGVVNPNNTISQALSNDSYNPVNDPLDNGIIGLRRYELSNHLGNELVIISDRKIGIDNSSDGIIDYYISDVVNANDYYTFGMGMPGRKFSAGGLYRYGFNGKENDNDVKGEGNQQDYGMRIYDPRVGRFLSTDPLQKNYAELTPYQFSSNSPIANIDLDGLESWAVNPSTGEVLSGPLDVNALKARGFVTGYYESKSPPVPRPQTQRAPALQITSESTNQGRSEMIQRRAISKSDVLRSKEWATLGPEGLVLRTKEQSEKMHAVGDMVAKANRERNEAVDNHRVSDDFPVIGSFVKAGRQTMAGDFGGAIKSSVLGGVEAYGLEAALIFGLRNISLSVSERAIVNEANGILNSSEFTKIKDAFINGTSAEVKINGRIIQYEPGFTYAEAMTLHESGGFLMGPRAFVSSEETGKTIIHELYRLRSQNTGQLGVDLTRSYTDGAVQAADKLSPHLKK